MRGSPYVVGTRVPVRRLWSFYRSGASVDTLLKRYPNLDAGKVFDALAFAFDNQAVVEADIAREEQLIQTSDGGPRLKQMPLPFEKAAFEKEEAS